jgi:hypothetical protein
LDNQTWQKRKAKDDLAIKLTLKSVPESEVWNCGTQGTLNYESGNMRKNVCRLTWFSTS